MLPLGTTSQTSHRPQFNVVGMSTLIGTCPTGLILYSRMKRDKINTFLYTRYKYSHMYSHILYIIDYTKILGRNFMDGIDKELVPWTANKKKTYY